MKEGWIERRQGKTGLTFRARYWAPNADGELAPKSQSFHEKRYGSRAKAEDAAKTHLARMLTEVHSGDYLAPSVTTLGETVRTWLESKTGISDSTRVNYEAAIKHLLPAYAALPVQQVKPLHVQRLYNELRRNGVGPGIMRQLHVVLNATLAQATNWEMIRRNPAKQVEAPAVAQPPVQFWTPEQLAAFLQTEGEHPGFGMLWTLLVLTGMRAGEARALRWTDVNLERRTITITRTVTRGADRRERIGDTTKTRNSRRTIPLPASCIAPLKRHQIHQKERQLKAETWDKTDGDLVFTTNAGRFLPSSSSRDAFVDAVIRTGLPPLTMHGIRHSYASGMLLAGIHPKVVAELLGDTVAMILRVYSHVTPASRNDASAMFAATIERIRDDMPEPAQG